MSLHTTSLSDDEIMNQIVKLLNKGKSVALAIIVNKEGSGPRDVGSKMLIDEDGKTYGTLGGGPFERHVVSEALKALKDGKPRLLKYSFTGKPVKGAIDTGLICGGILTVYIDVLKPVKRVLVFGTGRVGKPVTELFKFLGFRVVIADPNPELVSDNYIPFADERITGDVDAIANKLAEIAKPSDIALILHGEVEPDYKVTKAMLKSKVEFVGLLGSKRKVAEFIKRLVSEGVPKDIIIRKLHAPIGIDVGADKPEEIAVSIASQVLSYLNGASLKELSIVKDIISRIT